MGNSLFLRPEYISLKALIKSVREVALPGVKFFFIQSKRVFGRRPSGGGKTAPRCFSRYSYHYHSFGDMGKESSIFLYDELPFFLNSELYSSIILNSRASF